MVERNKSPYHFSQHSFKDTKNQKSKTYCVDLTDRDDDPYNLFHWYSFDTRVGGSRRKDLHWDNRIDISETTALGGQASIILNLFDCSIFPTSDFDLAYGVMHGAEGKTLMSPTFSCPKNWTPEKA